MNILHLDASGRHESSRSRILSQEMVDRLKQEHRGTVTYRDISQGLPFVNDTMIKSMYMPDTDRTEAQKQVLQLSNDLVEEFISADIVVLGIPVYNFTMPAAFKAYADLIARRGLTFKYTEKGPEGLVSDKDIYALITSGGTEVGSDADFLSPWLRHYFKFLGIQKDIEIISADGLMMTQDAQAKLEAAKKEIASVAH